MRSVTLVGAALAVVGFTAGCASQQVENYDAAQCGALGGAMVRQTDYSNPRSGFRVETQRCVFAPGPTLRQSP
jgi:hypothetical protein